jgi:hypothetical protein
MWVFFLTWAFAQPMNSEEVLQRENYILPEHALQLYKELVTKADSLQLASKPRWIRLLHYEDKALNRFVSDQEAEYFFRSPIGKKNPSAELHATIKDFLIPTDQFENQNHHPHCMFPARFTWLDEQLSLSEYDLPTVFCSDLLEWQQDVSLDTISLGFAGYYEGNPASFFGHTFLLLKSQNIDGKNLYPLISFGTEVPQETSTVAMITKGISGSYSGHYALEPYYERIKKYGHQELRNIWEYDLNYTDAEKDILLKHLWELGNVTSFPYLFFTKNCSYQLLTVLEMPRDSLQLSKQFPFWVQPSETIRAIQETPNFVSQVHFRPSLRQSFEDHISDKDSQYRETVQQLYQGKITPQSLTELSFDENQQAELIDTTLLLVQIDIESNQNKLNELPDSTRKLLITRNSLDIAKTIDTTPRIIETPSRGHEIQRINLLAGTNESAPFIGFTWRPAFHSDNDPQTAYPIASQQEISFDIRYQPQNQFLYLENATLLGLRYFTPPQYTSFIGKGWGLNSEFQREYLSPDTPVPWVNSAYYYKTIPWTDKGLFYGALGFGLSISPTWEHWTALQPSIRIGCWLYQNSRFRLSILGQVDSYFDDFEKLEPTINTRAQLQLSSKITERIGFDISTSHQQNQQNKVIHQELWAGFHHYF